MSWTNVTTNVIELHGTERMSFSLTDIIAEVTLEAPYELAAQICADMVGNAVPWPKFSFGRAIPRCIKADPSPAPNDNYIAGVGGTIQYTTAHIRATFSLKAPDPEDLFVETIEQTAEFMTMDNKRFRWGSKNGDPLLENEQVGRLMYQTVLSRRFFRLPQLPPGIYDLGGHVNENEYHSQKYDQTFAPETLLFIPPRTEESFTTDGSEGFALECQWVYKPQGWNRYYRAKSQEWEEIWDFDNDEKFKQYPTDPFDILLA